jgi:hypothetical protein
LSCSPRFIPFSHTLIDALLWPLRMTTGDGERKKTLQRRSHR